MKRVCGLIPEELYDLLKRNADFRGVEVEDIIKEHLLYYLKLVKVYKESAKVKYADYIKLEGGK